MSIRRARRRAGSPGWRPQRPMPISTSTSTPTVTPAPEAASESAATWPASSTATFRLTRPARRTSRWSLRRPTTWLAISRSSKPASASTSASPSLAQVMPTAAPASSWRRARAVHLWFLKWGRSRALRWRKKSAMRRMLRSEAGPSNNRAGVSRSSIGQPITPAPVSPPEKSLVMESPGSELKTSGPWGFGWVRENLERDENRTRDEEHGPCS